MAQLSAIRLLRLSLTLLFLLLPIHLRAQQSGGIMVTGRVPKAFYLESAGLETSSPQIAVHVSHVTDNTLLIAVSAPASVSEGTIVVPVTMRTNVSRFALRARASAGLRGARLKTSVARADGDGSMVVPGAVESFVPAEIVLKDEAVIATGTRISRRGNASTLGNAIVTDVAFTFQNSASQQNNQWTIAVTMDELTLDEL